MSLRISWALAASSLVFFACVGDSPTNQTGADASPGADSGTPDTSLVDGASCAAPKKVCTKGPQTVCTDVSSDDANCGSCNNSCPMGSNCKSSACACTDATKTFCAQNGSGVCTDVKTDPKNCGTCGNACPNSHCKDGECDRIAFVTSQGFSTSIGGSSGADALCQAAAMSGKLPGTYQAWLAVGTIGPSATFKTKSTTPYVLSDGTTVLADSFTALVTTGPKTALNLSELKSPVGSGSPDVMTNVNAQGAGSSASFDCGGWTSTNGTNKWFPADRTTTSSAWTDGSNVASCSATLIHHLYCFQQ